MNIPSFKSTYLRQVNIFEVIGSLCYPPSGPGWSSHLGQIQDGWFQGLALILAVSAPKPLEVDSCLLDSHCCHTEAR